MSVMDGAEVRKERILDMLNHIRVFFPNGIAMNQIILYMTLNHGLTDKTVKSYMKICEYAGVLKLSQGKYYVRESEFKKLIKWTSPDRDEDTGTLISGKVADLSNAVKEIEAEGGDEPKPKTEPEPETEKPRVRRYDSGVV